MQVWQRKRSVAGCHATRVAGARAQQTLPTPEVTPFLVECSGYRGLILHTLDSLKSKYTFSLQLHF